MGVGTKCEDFILHVKVLHARDTENVTWPVDINQLSSLAILNLKQGACKLSGHSGRDGGTT